ncbi:hypothetical protein [Micromonospora sp. NPDC000668]
MTVLHLHWLSVGGVRGRPSSQQTCRCGDRPGHAPPPKAREIVVRLF